MTKKVTKSATSPVDKRTRQQVIAQVLAERDIPSQQDLVLELEARGVTCTQASVSRDLTDLNVIKVDGVYRIPEVPMSVSKSGAGLVGDLTVEKAGDHLIVLRTGPGVAQAAALMIDRAKLEGLVGTVAGDDTIFLAVRSRDDQTAVIRQVLSLFNRS